MHFLNHSDCPGPSVISFSVFYCIYKLAYYINVYYCLYRTFRFEFIQPAESVQHSSRLLDECS